MPRPEHHVDAVDAALDDLAGDPDITEDQYYDALTDIHYRVGASLAGRRSPEGT